MQLLLTSVARMEKRLDDLTTLQTQVSSIAKDVDQFKVTINNLDQESRGRTVRITGLSIPEADVKQLGQEKAIMKRAYDKLIKPILTSAKNKTPADVDSVPVLLNVLEGGRFIGKGYVDQQGRTLPPAITVTFTNRYIRNVVMRLKKENTPDPTVAEKAAGIVRYSIAEDLTAINAKKLKEYRDNSSVHRAWTVDGRIRFVLVASDEVVRRAPSPFAPVAEVISKFT
jgi:hypothetical protein